mmetsp:Transcript_20010/g.55341  ORF Transcript_20010/g.55341 Transcript_20010/m.55341 type:complete len:262 (+) Transcript_20010:492-1277(+)
MPSSTCMGPMVPSPRTTLATSSFGGRRFRGSSACASSPEGAWIYSITCATTPKTMPPRVALSDCRGPKCTLNSDWLASLGRRARQCRTTVLFGAPTGPSFASTKAAGNGGTMCTWVVNSSTLGGETLMLGWMTARLSEFELHHLQTKLAEQTALDKEQYCKPRWIEGYCEKKYHHRYAECKLPSGQLCKQGLVIPNGKFTDTHKWAELFPEEDIDKEAFEQGPPVLLTTLLTPPPPSGAQARLPREWRRRAAGNTNEHDFL